MTFVLEHLFVIKNNIQIVIVNEENIEGIMNKINENKETVVHVTGVKNYELMNKLSTKLNKIKIPYCLIISIGIINEDKKQKIFHLIKRRYNLTNNRITN